MLSSIRTAIKNKLDNVNIFSSVYDYHKVGVDGFPCATFEPTRVTNDGFDNCNNKVVYEFDIIIQQGINEITKRGKSMDILIDSVQTIVNTFNADRTLGGLCTAIITRDTNFGEVIHDKGHILYVTISVSCETISFNTI